MSEQREAIVQRIQAAGLVAILRTREEASLVEACRALVNGGVRCAEITMTTPGALSAIEQASEALGDRCWLGVGSVTDAATARQAMDAGAQFVVSPITVPEVIDAAHQREKPAMPGAFTPNEIHAASAAGGDVIKVFPANHLGPRYFKDVLAPMPGLRLTPTGGVALNNIGDWFDAGATALGVGSALVKQELIVHESWEELARRAGRFTAAVDAAQNDEAEESESQVV